jgi:predicted RNase H-like HicB family nuclease
MSDSLQLTIVYQDGDDGWIIASIPEVSGTISQGRTREDARVHVIDALRLMLSLEPSDKRDVSSDSEVLTLRISECGAATASEPRSLEDQSGRQRNRISLRVGVKH